VLDKFAARIKKIAKLKPDRVIAKATPWSSFSIDRGGRRYRHSGARGRTGNEGPGPLVTHLAKNAGSFRYPWRSSPAISATPISMEWLDKSA